VSLLHCALALLVAAGSTAGSSAPGSTARQARKTTPAARFDRIAKQAADAKAAGRLEEAVGHYQSALELRPAWTDGRWALATLLYDLDRFAEAREQFEQVVAARPQDGVALALKALCAVRLKEYDLAFAELRKAHGFGIAAPEVASVAGFQMALLLNRAGNPDAAFEILRGFATQGKDDPAVIEAFGLAMLRLPYMPEDVPADKWEMIRLAGRGGYHMSRGRRTAIGRLALDELVSRYPTQPHVHYALGSYVAPEEPEAAIQEFRKELARDADHYPSLLQIASVALRLGRAQEALPSAEAAARVAPDVPAARLVLGRALLEAGDVERAVRELEKGATLAPESPDLQFALARAYQRAGRAEDAERAREAFRRLDKAIRERAGDEDGPDPEPEASRGQGPAPDAGGS
jgi:tetratricopeptide (TPR) repeat protein